ncbi:hypothetical protein [Gordonia sp. CPCC 205333]|uniref:hypothetical protein n=1 Tax=Gordonia sp. CPCC 205333 TaxID=3140790 RepID=UPI003AF3D4ED
MTATKVFISWSGSPSLVVARVWAALLRDVFDDSVDCFISDEMEAGVISMAQIRANLDGAKFAIIVTTRANQNAKWLNFEAGVVSRQLPDDEMPRVVPCLVDFDAMKEVTGPLTMFQMKMLTEKGVEETVRSLASVLGAATNVHTKRFGLLWDTEYKEAFEKAAAVVKNSKDPIPDPRPEKDILAEVLEGVRRLQAGQSQNSMSRGPAAQNPPLPLRDFSRARMDHAIHRWLVKNKFDPSHIVEIDQVNHPDDDLSLVTVKTTLPVNAANALENSLNSAFGDISSTVFFNCESG